MADDVAVRVEHVSKAFKLPHERHTTLKSLIINPFRRRKGYERQQVLKDITFEVKTGEFFGIVGRNGGGKSTLLKLLASIYAPDKGSIRVRGKLVPFIELGVGFSPELTGRDNVYLNGALLGFSDREIDSMYDDIVAFAELEKFMDQKLKNYSSGMQVRLAFAIATQSKADVLLVDEVLAVGDASFQRKCYNYFSSLKKEKKTVIFISHDMDAVRQYCDRAMLIEQGEVRLTGSASEVAAAYSQLFLEEASTGQAEHKREGNRWGERLNLIGEVTPQVTSKKISLSCGLAIPSEYGAPVIGFVVKNAAGLALVGANTSVVQADTTRLPGTPQKIVWQFENILSDGEYTADLAVLDKDGVTVLEWLEAAAGFTVKRYPISPYPVSPNITFSAYSEEAIDEDTR